MPYVSIQTNAEPDESKQARLLQDVSSRLARELAKPESYVMVAMRPQADMLFGGSRADCAFVELKSIGLPHTQTTALAKLICELMQQHLGVPPERTYVEFSDAERALWGWNSGTF